MIDLACLAIVILPMLAAYVIIWALCRIAASADEDKDSP